MRFYTGTKGDCESIKTIKARYAPPQSLQGVLDEAIWRVAAINQNRTATRQIGLHRCFAVFRRFRSLQ